MFFTFPRSILYLQQFQKSEDQQMCRIERIAEIPEPPAVISLPSAVQPDRNQREKRESLSGQFERSAEQGDFIHKSAQQLHIDVPQTDKLAQIPPPYPSAEEIEDQYGENACVVEIHKGQKSYNWLGYLLLPLQGDHAR